MFILKSTPIVISFHSASAIATTSVPNLTNRQTSTKMKLIFTLATIVAFAAASPQAGGAPPTVPACGLPVFMPAFQSSKCPAPPAEGAAKCLCSSAPLKEALNTKLSAACPAAADKKAYEDVANKLCMGEAGYPITIA